jgi:hypothetical protein
MLSMRPNIRLKGPNIGKLRYNETINTNLESVADETGPLRRCRRQPLPSRWTSSVVIRSQLYAAVAVSACQDTLQLASRL